MNFRKILMWLIVIGSIVFLIMLFVQRLQAKSINDVVAQIKGEKKEEAVARRIKFTKTFAVGPQGLTSVDGIKNVPGIESAWAIGITGNDLGTLEDGTFEGPRFKNLTLLDLSSNKLHTIQPGALRLKNVRILFLNNNNITFLDEDVFNETPQLKIIGIGGNPPQGEQRVREIVKKKLPHTYVYSGKITLQFIRRALAVGTAVSVAIAAAIIYYLFKRPRPEVMDDFGGLGEVTAEEEGIEETMGPIVHEVEAGPTQYRDVKVSDLIKTVETYLENPTSEGKSAAEKAMIELDQERISYFKNAQNLFNIWQDLQKTAPGSEGEYAAQKFYKDAEDGYMEILAIIKNLKKRMSFLSEAQKEDVAYFAKEEKDVKKRLAELEMEAEEQAIKTLRRKKKEEEALEGMRRLFKEDAPNQ